MAIGGGLVSDLYAPGQRTRPMAWCSVGMMMAPTLGPVLGGLITGGLGWRWVFWIASIMVSIPWHPSGLLQGLMTVRGCAVRLCLVLSTGRNASSDSRSKGG
jgi:MFS family permease